MSTRKRLTPSPRSHVTAAVRLVEMMHSGDAVEREGRCRDRGRGKGKSQFSWYQGLNNQENHEEGFPINQCCKILLSPVRFLLASCTDSTTSKKLSVEFYALVY